MSQTAPRTPADLVAQVTDPLDRVAYVTALVAPRRTLTRAWAQQRLHDLLLVLPHYTQRDIANRIGISAPRVNNLAKKALGGSTP